MNITPNKPVKMRIFSLPCSLPVVRAALEQLCRMAGFSNASIGGIVASVDEAMANIIKHAYKGAKDKNIDIELLPFQQADGAGVRITLRDYGPGVDPAQIKPRDLEDVVPGGLGVHIMRQNMDSIEYQPADGGGTVLTLAKKFHPFSHQGCQASRYGHDRGGHRRHRSQSQPRLPTGHDGAP